MWDITVLINKDVIMTWLVGLVWIIKTVLKVLRLEIAHCHTYYNIVEYNFSVDTAILNNKKSRLDHKSQVHQHIHHEKALK